MQSTLRITIFLCLFVLGFLPAIAQVKKPDTSIKGGETVKPAVKPTTDEPKDTAIAFPDVDGWDREEAYTYPTEGAGYSVNYNSDDNGRVTIYVYNAGHSTIPNDLKGIVKGELEGAKDAIRAARDAGVYEKVKETKTQTVMLGGPKGKVNVLRSHFELTRDNVKMNSEIYVFPYRNNIIKLRVTRPAVADKTLDESYANLLLEIDSLFSK